MMAYINYKRKEEINALLQKRNITRQAAEIRAKYKVPRDFKEDRETTAKAGLLKLHRETGDSVFSDAVRIREFGKLKSTYVDGWEPGDDACAHPFFGFAPATSQLSSEAPNAQNIPSEKSRGAAISPAIAKHAASFRRLLRAKPGKVLIEFDWRAFHALMLGFWAEDAKYMRLARLDIHSYFAACRLLKLATSEKLLAMPDDALAEYLAWVKANYPVVRDGQAKPAILGYGLGMREHTLWVQNLDSFASRSAAAQVLREMDAEFSITCAWREQITLWAQEGGPDNPANCLVLEPWSIRRFWSVFNNQPVKDTYRKKPSEELFYSVRPNGSKAWYKVAPGPDHEAAIAFFVQNGAHGHMKENMLAIDDEHDWGERYGLCNTVHDALWFHCPFELADECYSIIKPQMQAPSTVLKNAIAPEGFWCATDETIGYDMQARSKFHV
jgi:hypothetical protein